MDKLSPSLMCMDFGHIQETLETFRQNGIELLHIDIMDGLFVPNYALGVDFCKKIRAMTDIPLDIHLMVENPDDKLGWFGLREGEYAAVHWESTNHMQRILATIRQTGAHPMAALNPATPLSVLDYILDDIDAVLIMTVNPGYAGQKIIPATLQKIQDCRRYLDAKGRTDIEIEVDGNVSFENAVKMKAKGSNIFVGGSSSIFCTSATVRENILHMRSALAG